jgi:eukaryotic-like serine/threonine-protein kinase
MARVEIDPRAETPTAGEPSGAESSSEPDQATRQMRRTSGHTAASGGRHTEPTIELSRGALRDEEMGRVRVTVQVLAGLAGVGLALAPIMGGDPFAKRVFLFGLLWALLTMFAILRNASNPAAYSVHFVGAASIALSVASTCAVYYIGAFSPAAMIGALGLYIFSLGGSTTWSIALYAALAVPHALFATLFIWAFAPDRGLVQAGKLTILDKLAIQGCVQTVYCIAFIAGRTSRGKLEAIVHELEVAARKIAERDALLNEAKRELQRVWVGGEGRFTDQIVGSFRLGHVIGRGGMGEVYEGTHLQTSTEVAVKLLQRSVFADPQTLSRFAREAKAVAALDSPYVVRVIEVPDEHSPIPYLAMERLRGEDLASMLRREKRLSSREIIQLVTQVGAALDVARKAGVIHRDMKPQNLFLTRREEGASVWKVLDFGVSKFAGQETLTRDQLVGTPEYMAPEQASGKPVDYRADLYGLSAVLYRCVVARAPFSDESLPALVHKVVHEMPLRPSVIGRVSLDVEAVLTVGLAKHPDDRFQSGAELASAWVQALHEELSPALRDKAEQLALKMPWKE